MEAVADSKDILNKFTEPTIKIKEKFKKNGRFTPNTREDLDEAIKIFMEDRKLAINIFGHMNTWDVSKITDMSKLFWGHKNFNEDISKWDVSNVTNMSDMFRKCTSFNQDISKWDVSNVTDMGYMFAYCTSFNQPLNNWDVSNVTNMNNMFRGCTDFNKPLNNWNVSNVTYMGGEFGGMFCGCTSFKHVIHISIWKTRKRVEKRKMLTHTPYDRVYKKFKKAF